MGPRFDFYPRGFENTPHPCLVVDDPQGGDPHILALISVIYRPTDLQGLCDMANAYLSSIEPAPPSIAPSAKVETHIDRECALLGHEFAYGPHEEDEFPAPTCVHCGVSA